MKTIVEALNGLTTKLGGESSSPETIVGALHDVYGALGGSSPVSDTIADAVDEVTTVASSGGGGSSDFSTAEVTFICNGGEGYNFVITGGYYIYNNGSLIPTPVHPIQVDYFDNVTVEIPLYKGESLIPIACFDNTGENLPVCTGDIVFDQSGFTISGDGTITIQGGELV